MVQHILKMGWKCEKCTYLNPNNNVLACDVCQSRRTGKQAEKAAGNTTRQTTLFGHFADPKKLKGKKSTARKKVPAQEMPKKLSESDRQLFPLQALHGLPYEDLSQRAQDILRRIYGFESLRPLQQQAVEHTLRRQSQIIVMATGGGKSLCYQLPALALGGVTLVIAPLKALIADQVQSLVRRGIPAAFLSSQLSEAAKIDVMERVLQRSLRNGSTPADAASWKGKSVNLLYCTPELLRTDRFRSSLLELHRNKRLTGFAVDEAHCVSSWGHDFRPAFLKLDYLRKTFPELPLMACTATATPKVIQDIQKILRLEDRPCHVGSFDRKNIFYKVRYRDVLEETTANGATGDLVEFIKKRHQKAQKSGQKCNGIVYVHRQKDTVELASIITKETGVRAEGYHGGMKDVDRIRVQEAWTAGEAPIAIATVAFGMGIDLPHVRYVVHWNLAKSVEGFYQESGRAGRDGLPAYSLLYFSKSDVSMFGYLARMKKSKQKDANIHALDALEKMVDYCTDPGCRRRYLLQFFGEQETDPKLVCRKTCDYCQRPEKVRKAIEAASCVTDFSFHTATSSEWDGQWGKPHGDDESENVNDSDDDFHESAGAKSQGLSLFGEEVDALSGDSSHVKPSGKVGFAKASDILAKYEAQENSARQASSVSRKRKHAPPVLPEHLRESMPDPLSNFEPKKKEKTSAELGADVSRLKAELETLRAAREALAKKSSVSSRGASSNKIGVVPWLNLILTVALLVLMAEPSLAREGRQTSFMNRQYRYFGWFPRGGQLINSPNEGFEASTTAEPVLDESTIEQTSVEINSAPDGSLVRDDHVHVSNATSANNATTPSMKDMPKWKAALPPLLQKKGNRTLQRLILGNVEIYLLGTAHVSRDSCQDVKLLLEALHPSCIFVELCDARIPLLDGSDNVVPDEDLGNETNATQLSWGQRVGRIQESQGGSKWQAICTLLLTSVQEDYADTLGVELGGEFRAAHQYWQDQRRLLVEREGFYQRPSGFPALILGDRPLSLTLVRAWESLWWWPKIKVMLGLLWSSFHKPDKEEIRAWLESVLREESDVLTESLADLCKHFPTLHTTIIEERDAWLACKLVQTCRILHGTAGGATSRPISPQQRVKLVAIVGAGHVPGIIDMLTSNKQNRTTEAILLELSRTKRWQNDEVMQTQVIPRWVHDVTQIQDPVS